MRASLISRFRRHVFALTALTVLAGCGDGRADAEASRNDKTTGVGVLGMKPGMTRTDYMAMPDSARLGTGEDGGIFGTDRGVGVELDVQLDGQEGDSIPLAYSLHDARNHVHFVSQTIPVVPDAPRWRRKVHVWLPVPSPGTYYVRVVLADSTGRSTQGPRTEDFTIQ